MTTFSVNRLGTFTGALASRRDHRQQSARFADDAVLELRVAHTRGCEQRMATLVVVDASRTAFIDNGLGDHARGSLRGAQRLYEGREQRHEQRNEVFRQEEHEGAAIARESGSGIDAGLDL